MSTQTWQIDTPGGPARAHLHPDPKGRPRAALVLGHGAGGGVDAPDLVAIAAALPADGIEVVLIEAPWRVAGKRIGGSPSSLDRAWIECLRDVSSRGIGVRRMVVGGRSAGARVACRTVAEVAPSAMLLLAFPVHPARRRSLTGPPPSRLPELVAGAQAVPTVVVQGTRDALGSPGEIAEGLALEHVGARVVPVVDADHSFQVPVRAQSSTQEALDLVVRAARATALGIVDGSH